MNWKDRRRAHRGPAWRRVSYHAARWLAVLTLGPVVWAGHALAALEGPVTRGLTAVERWAYPGLYAERPR